MPTLIITAMYPTYNGTTFGVKFEDGRAVLNEHSNRTRWGYSLEQLAEKLRVDLPGYGVEFIPNPKPALEAEGEAAPGAPGGASVAKPVKARKRTKGKAQSARPAEAAI